VVENPMSIRSRFRERAHAARLSERQIVLTEMDTSAPTPARRRGDR